MAIALNAHNGVRAGGAHGATRAANSLPGAAVWDSPQVGRTPRREPVSGAYSASRVRTLKADNRTYQPRVSRPAQALAVNRDAARALERLEKQRENRSNYLLGAVFGCALFFGTVFAGLSGVEADSAVGGTSQVETVQAVVVAK